MVCEVPSVQFSAGREWVIGVSTAHLVLYKPYSYRGSSFLCKVWTLIS